MNELKRRSIETPQLWVACGRPWYDPVYRDRCRARAEYRRSIKDQSQIATTRISNDLHEQLLTKDTVSFRKTWKNKINKRRTAVSCVDGDTNATDIANKFAINRLSAGMFTK